MAAALVLAAAPAGAVCVYPGAVPATGCFPTLQAGVNATPAGGRLDVFAGTYLENVVIPAGKDGMRLVAQQGAVLDPDAPNTGVGLTIASNGVSVRGLAIHNGQSHAIEILPGVTDTLLRELHIRGANGYCVRADGVGGGSDRTRLLNSTLVACEGQGFGVTGDDAVAWNNTFLQINDLFVDIDGDRARVENNVGRIALEQCVSVTGDDAEISGNRLEGCDSRGIDSRGLRTLVYHNEISHVSGTGLRVQGGLQQVTHNLVAGVHGTGLDFSCNDCDGARILDNQIRYSGGSRPGYDLGPNAPGLEVGRNFGWSFFEEAFDLDGPGATFHENRAEASGTGFENCFRVSGADHAVSWNSAYRCQGDGFAVVAGSDRAMLHRNVATDGAGDGFDVEANTDETRLTQNAALRNAGAGFEVSDGAPPADMTTLASNAAIVNGVDLCHEGTNTTLAGNLFATTLAPPVDGTQDCPGGD